jgi:putative dimethyl sulfoxide reductase chaperone
MPEQDSPLRGVTAGDRANVYYALARALQSPSTWPEDLPELLLAALNGMQEGFDGCGAQLKAHIPDSMDARKELAVAHAKLMVGPFELLAAPWACFYLEDEPQLMGPTSQYVARAYADAGLGPGEQLKDTPDHVTHELEFMYFLAFNQATTGELVWSERQMRFWREHLGRWLSKFADAVAATNVHPFYSHLAEMLTVFCGLEEATLGVTEPTRDSGSALVGNQV